MSNQFFADEFYMVHPSNCLFSGKCNSNSLEQRFHNIAGQIALWQRLTGTRLISTPNISYKAHTRLHISRELSCIIMYQCQRLQDSSAKWALLNGILSDSLQIWSQSKYNQLRKFHMPVYHIMYHIITIIYHLFPCLWYLQLGFMEDMICFLPLGQ